MADEEGGQTPVTPLPPPGSSEEMDVDGSGSDEESSEAESMGADSDDETPEYDENRPPEEQLMDFAYCAIKIVNCDFLSEFGAADPCVIDGDSLVAHALTDPLLTPGGAAQSLHVVHIVESILAAMTKRGANFQVFFFEGNMALWDRMGPTACAMRELVMNHLLMANAQVQAAPPHPSSPDHHTPLDRPGHGSARCLRGTPPPQPSDIPRPRAATDPRILVRSARRGTSPLWRACTCCGGRGGLPRRTGRSCLTRSLSRAGEGPFVAR
jgi:hypothetical protein